MAVAGLILFLLLIFGIRPLLAPGPFPTRFLARLMLWVAGGTFIIALLALSAGAASAVRKGATRAAEAGAFLGRFFLVIMALGLLLPAVPQPPPQRRI